MKRSKNSANVSSSPLVQHKQKFMFFPRRLAVLAGIIIAMLLVQVGYFYWQYDQGQMDYSLVQNMFDEYEQQLVEKQTLIDEFQQQLASKQAQLEEQQRVIDELDDRLLKLDEQYVFLKQEINATSTLLVDKNSEIALLEQQYIDSQQALKKKSSQLYSLQRRFDREVNIAIAKERRKLTESQLMVDQELAQLQSQEAEISAKISSVDEWERKRAEFEKLYASSALEKQNEERVSKLMDQFNELRVDLDVVNECDKDYLYRYNEAKSLLNHIRTFIQKYKMREEFYYYVISNDSMINSQNRKLCVVD
ncbi:hypothetical protein C9J03_13020 [Photobacterium gaetbulicola]|uniref:Putative membrane protein n=1 Tax=Photobacterium gaetbulicola Gung47 TaxID=658445 RepID=A0A0C5WTE2_9GAMM|nr:hypothetical protein [Photobacterium gaetbulicola]AJR08299.1 putative membrane protein [Photobacterium gaetbulicola Gung47]PSU09025.1 hypothetical protein C9J03_13020 [Photobacterium gaetbulicola]